MPDDWPRIIASINPVALTEHNPSPIVLMGRSDLIDPDSEHHRYTPMAALTTSEAVRLGMMLVGFGSEAATTVAYQTALRSHKLDEKDVIEIMTDATHILNRMRRE